MYLIITNIFKYEFYIQSCPCLYMGICMWMQCPEEVRKFGIKLQKAENHTRQVGAGGPPQSSGRAVWPGRPGSLWKHISKAHQLTKVLQEWSEVSQSHRLSSPTTIKTIILHGTVPLLLLILLPFGSVQKLTDGNPQKQATPLTPRAPSPFWVQWINLNISIF